MDGSSFSFVAHDPADDVGVAVRNLSAGDVVNGRVLGDGGSVPEEITAEVDIPLGHKIALRAVQEGAEVIKYGVAVGIATEDIPAGAHVHTHNVRSTKWQVTA